MSSVTWRLRVSPARRLGWNDLRFASETLFLIGQAEIAASFENSDFRRVIHRVYAGGTRIRFAASGCGTLARGWSDRAVRYRGGVQKMR